MSLNLTQLEQVVEHDADNLEQLQYWYDQLIEYELEGNEQRKDLEIIFRAMKWIMQYEHTSVDELKEIAEKEAIELAEREENWEQEKEILKEELSVLRERITGQAGVTETYEAFRGEIDALKAENAQLKQLSRERDRELADQRDKAEQMSSRVDALEKERTMLVNNTETLEDTIRQLNLRISSKTEVSGRGDWESRRLRQRSEQAILLSNQLQSVISQNEQLKVEVERLSNALQNATALIQETTTNYGSLQEQLAIAEKTIAALAEDNSTLKEQISTRDQTLHEKQAKHELTSREMEELLEEKDKEISKLKGELNLIMIELDDYRTRLQIEQSRDNNEAELERLSQELRRQVELARQMFDSMTSETHTDQILDPNVEMRIRLMQLEERLQTTQSYMKDSEAEKTNMQRIIEEKDAQNAQLHADMNRFRQVTFGDADKEIRHLEAQLKFRDKQIQKLTSKCSLLQIEIEQLSEKPQRIQKEAITDKRKELGPIQEATQKPIKKPRIEVSKETAKSHVDTKQDVIIKKDSEKFEVIEPKELTQEKLDELEAYATIISSLNHEVMQLLKELEAKDEQIRKLEVFQKDADKHIRMSMAQVSLISHEYKDFYLKQSLNKPDRSDTNDNRLQELEIRAVELERLNESITIGGTELERRMEEATRRLIFVQIQNMHFSRVAETAERKSKIVNEICEKLRSRVRHLMLDSERRSRQIVLENELNTIEIARLQTALFRSIPLSEYNKLLTRFKTLLHREVLGNEVPISEDVQEYHFESINLLSTSEKSFEELKVTNKRLEEENRILANQTDYWRNEAERYKTNVDELNVFLTDIENESEVKNMLVNIERRFLIAMNEQSEILGERSVSEKEHRRLQKEFNKRRKQWFGDRKKLVNAVLSLQNLVQRLRLNFADNITVEQMLSFKNAMELLRDKESQLHKEHSILEKKSVDLERESINVEAMRISIQETVDSNFDVQRMQKALQNFAFNIQTLASENRVLHAQIKSLNNDIERKTIEFEELKEENERVLAATINLATLSDDHAEKEHISKEKSTEIERQEKVSREPLVSSDDESSSTDYETIHQKEDKQDRVQLKTVVFDNSKEYERRVEMVKETARLCIQSYKEQLDQKDRAIEQYRVMLENSRISFAETPHDTSIRSSDSALPLKKSTEILNNLKLEEKEKEIRKLEQEIQELERINAELGLELKRFGESNISTKKHLFDVAIQTDHFTGSGSAVNVVVQSTTTKESSDSEELSSKDEPHTQERNYEDEFEESDQSSRVSSEGSTSDSGTVEDIDKPPSRRGSRTSSLSSNQGQQPDLPPKPVEPKKDGEHSLPASSRTEASDHAVIRLRSEIRNLRSRLMITERKNRELLTEVESLKSRTRFSSQRAVSTSDGEVTFLKKDNDRFRREIKNLNSTIESKTKEIDELQKTIKRLSSLPHKDALDNWEERKKKDRALAELKRKLEEAINRENELAERLERRERHIDQINKDENKRYTESERLTALTRELQQEKEMFKKRETSLINEIRIWTEKCKEATIRLESVAKENKALRSAQKSLKTQDAQVQTHGLEKPIHEPSPKVPKIPMQEMPKIPIQEIRTYRESLRDDTFQSLQREHRRAQLRELEASDELRSIRIAYEKLQKDYSSLLTTERRRTNAKEGAAITVLRDKLMAKDREIETLRHKINGLEQTILQISTP